MRIFKGKKFFGNLSGLDLWLLHRIAAKAVVQGRYHGDNIITIYRLVQDAAQKEFTEESPVSLKQYLIELHNTALNCK